MNSERKMDAVKSIRALNVGHVLYGVKLYRKRERDRTHGIHMGLGRGAVTPAPPTLPPAST